MWLFSVIFFRFWHKAHDLRARKKERPFGGENGEKGVFAQIIIWLRNNVQSAKQCLSCIHKAFKKYKWKELNTFINGSIHFLTHDDALWTHERHCLALWTLFLNQMMIWAKKPGFAIFAPKPHFTPIWPMVAYAVKMRHHESKNVLKRL